MTNEVQAHETYTSIAKAPSVALDAGTDMVLKVRVGCALACDLWGKIVRIVGHDAVVAKEVVLTDYDGTASETDEIVLAAPAKPGEYTWTAVFLAQEKQGVLHGESSVPFSFTVKPHAIGMTVWDVPSTIALGSVFRIKVGVKCSAECELTGRKIEIYDHEEALVATGALADVLGSTTGAQSCAQVELIAPVVEGRYIWEVRFPRPDMEHAHEPDTCTFAFGVARLPEHTVTVRVVDKDIKMPIENATVLLRPLLYRGSAYTDHTDDAGVARVDVPKGEYQVFVSGNGKELFLPVVTVAENVCVDAELVVVKREWWE